MCLGGMDGEEREGQWGRGRGMEKEERGREGGEGWRRKREGGRKDEEKEDEFCMHTLSAIPVQLVHWSHFHLVVMDLVSDRGITSQ